MRTSRRILQVNELLREEIGTLMIGETSDPVLMGLTVTEVRTSKDLSHAKVFMMCRRPEEGEAELGTRENLDYAAERVQKMLHGRLRLKKTPILDFRVDDTAEKAERIDQLLDQVKDDLIDAERDSERE